jgi:hypothetical protein
MILIRKLARGWFSRAIVALTGWTSNVPSSTARANVTETDLGKEVETNDKRGGAQITKRTTITVETERVLVVRTERRS